MPRRQALIAGASALASALPGIWWGIAAMRATNPFGADFPGYRLEMRAGGFAVLIMSSALAVIGANMLRWALVSRDGMVEIRLPTLGIPPSSLLRVLVAAAALVFVVATIHIQRLAHAICLTTGLAERDVPAVARSSWTVAAAVVLGVLAVAASPAASSPRWRTRAMQIAFAAAMALFVAIGYAVVHVLWEHMTLER